MGKDLGIWVNICPHPKYSNNIPRIPQRRFTHINTELKTLFGETHSSIPWDDR